MIFFEKVRGKHFLSIGNDPIEVKFKNGINIITGINYDKQKRSNGSGKSSTIEMIFFALFGKTLRKLKMSEISNDQTKKGAYVELFFRKGKDTYRIVRQLKPSKLSFFKSDKEISRDSIENTQNDIEKVVGASEDVFKNQVIMELSQTTSFMAQSKVEKRKYIEGIFDMSIFSDMLKHTRKESNDLDKKFTALCSQTDEKEKNLEIYKDKSTYFEDSQKYKRKEINENIENHKKNLEKYKNDLKKYEKGDITSQINDLRVDRKKYQSNLEKIEEKLDLLKDNRRTISSKIDSISDTIESTFKGDICPTCKRPMSKDDLHKVNEEIAKLKEKSASLTKKEAKLDDAINQIKLKIKKTKESIEKCQDDIKELESRADKADILKERIEEVKRYVFQGEESLKRVDKEVNEFEELHKKLKKEVSKSKSEIENMTEEMEILDKIKFILGENGVKSYIVNKMLSVLNNKVNFYLSKLHANAVLEFNEFFEETIINDKNIEKSYHSFSAGEKRNIDIAIMFAFMDLQRMQGKFDCNIMIFDELLDTSIDSDGVGYIINDILMPHVKDNGKMIYIVSHKLDSQKYATGENIEIHKRNSISKLKI